ncbi:hypothetical protein CA51_38450 [Rosistilla oblonga]|uniref:Uncharacterized protein n=2 Tax=Rosistilla TaxID=2795779 RepID=A0A518IXN6_9BACT|nr:MULTISPECIES: hypothetical protein [Rosistilla]QDS90004.1 hypothetical protein EC9_42070 [Rosistilla ulvae]QDV13953.1 hypothetical protein CA51_38450 [Rosistilla oblonga]QDV57851.1 hypothetical protein Mal33_38660 [Rosistilla oblonga]
MAEQHSRHQEKIIKNYYRNRDQIALQRSQELVTELYLTTGKKREQVWKNLAGHLEKLGLPAAQITHLQEQDDPAVIAEVIQKYA